MEKEKKFRGFEKLYFLNFGKRRMGLNRGYIDRGYIDKVGGEVGIFLYIEVKKRICFRMKVRLIL